MNRIVITDEWVHVEAFDPKPRGSCREVGDLALLWAIARLTDQLQRSLEFRRAYENAQTDEERMAVRPTDKVSV
jgi:hypothetical protein